MPSNNRRKSIRYNNESDSFLADENDPLHRKIEAQGGYIVESTTTLPTPKDGAWETYSKEEWEKNNELEYYYRRRHSDDGLFLDDVDDNNSNSGFKCSSGARAQRAAEILMVNDRETDDGEG